VLENYFTETYFHDVDFALEHWDHGFESCSGRGYVTVIFVLCYFV
jgi:hypothetical protein